MFEKKSTNEMTLLVEHSAGLVESRTIKRYLN